MKAERNLGRGRVEGGMQGGRKAAERGKRAEGREGGRRGKIERFAGAGGSGSERKPEGAANGIDFAQCRERLGALVPIHEACFARSDRQSALLKAGLVDEKGL
eukprot:4431212-Pleurochrysis_carterae.AAC.2